jgi:hypothetical protein
MRCRALTGKESRASKQAGSRSSLIMGGCCSLLVRTAAAAVCSPAALLPSILPLSLPVLYCQLALALARQPGWRFVASIDYLVLLSTRRLDGMCFVS